MNLKREYTLSADDVREAINFFLKEKYGENNITSINFNVKQVSKGHQRDPYTVLELTGATVQTDPKPSNNSGLNFPPGVR